MSSRALVVGVGCRPAKLTGLLLLPACAGVLSGAELQANRQAKILPDDL